ncbi:MAG: class I SAM-dependent methyltransferase [Dehalococcoidia bacterium]|nr:MAG: class I SAM-dependent methyltransferase [Dehalococcoidia bacterium]
MTTINTLPRTSVARQDAAHSSATYSLQDVPNCVLCRGTSTRHLFDIPPYGYRTCSTCGLTRLSPRIAEADLQRFYEEHYEDVYRLDAECVQRQLANPTFSYRARRLARHSPGRSFFEVGCGDGNFLAVLRDQGWEVAGSDVSDAAARVARERHGISVAVVSVDSGAVSGRWDAVGLYHVLEHLYEPRAVLRRVRDALVVGGIVHIQMPNRRSLDGHLGRQYWWGLRCPEHVFFYEPKHLRSLLAAEGFEVASIETYDPWHSPGTMEITARSVLKALLRRSSPVTSACDPGETKIGEESSDNVPWRRLPSRALRGLSVVAAQGQARIGLGNVVDVIAVRRG